MKASHGQRVAEVAVALTQRRCARLAEIADALEAPLTSVQRAAGALVADGLVVSEGARAPVYSLNADHPAVDGLIEFSLRVMPIERAMNIVLRASPATQFAGRDVDGYLIVLSPFAEPTDAANLESTLRRINRSRADAVRYHVLERHELRERLRDDLELRECGLKLACVKGSAARTFRDPFGRGSFDSPKLGRLHPSIPAVSSRALRNLAAEHGLARLVAFGSAVRDDFGEGSDVDVMYEPLPDSRVGLTDLIDMRQRLEELFDRDVDLVNSRTLPDTFRRRAQDEGVVLYG